MIYIDYSSVAFIMWVFDNIEYGEISRLYNVIPRNYNS